MKSIVLVMSLMCCICASSQGGTAAAGSEPTTITDLLPVGVRVTEVEVNSASDDRDIMTEDWVEICNTTAIPIDVSGWVIEAEVHSWTQKGGTRRSDPIPPGTLLYPCECYVVRRGGFWMTNETTRVIRLFALVSLPSGLRSMAVVDEAMWGFTPENPYDYFRDSAGDSRTFQLVLGNGHSSWVFREETPDQWDVDPGC